MPIIRLNNAQKLYMPLQKFAIVEKIIDNTIQKSYLVIFGIAKRGKAPDTSYNDLRR